MTSTLDHVGLIVADIDAADRFLTEVLGLRPSGREPNPGVRARFYEAGGIRLQIVEDPARLRGSPRARLDHIAFEVDDIDQVCHEAARHDSTLVFDEPLVHGGDQRSQFLTDSGGLGVVIQLNDHRGSPDGRHYEPKDMDTLREAMAGDSGGAT